ncbi:MAG: YihY/virulence factor BrkB family protein [Anaerolineales bacterium]|nr:YihY/virulence factor BrkB family protein [Anaerolineales bacterium]
MNILRKIFELLRETAVGFGRDHGSMLAASLAYYTIFAIAPLLVIAVAVAGFVFGEAAAEGQIVTAIQDTVGREAAVVIEQLVAKSGESNAGTIATIISTTLLFFGASGLFGQLQRALNIIWGITPDPGQGITGVIRKRLLSFGMVLLVGLLLLLSLTAGTIINALGNLLEHIFPVVGPLLPSMEVIASFALLILLFTLLFRILPDADVSWRDVFLGAVVTAVFFTIGEYLIGLYLSHSTVSSTYGAAGSLVIVLLWIYYSAQIMLFGAEFTQTYANKYGSKVKPADEETPPSPLPPEVDFSALPTSSTYLAYEHIGINDKTAVFPSGNLQKQIATGLLGIAVGLLIAFFNEKQKTKNGKQKTASHAPITDY